MISIKPRSRRARKISESKVATVKLYSQQGAKDVRAAMTVLRRKALLAAAVGLEQSHGTYFAASLLADSGIDIEDALRTLSGDRERIGYAYRTTQADSQIS